MSWTYYNLTTNGSIGSILTAIDTPSGGILIPALILCVFAITLISVFYRSPKMAVAVSGFFSMLTAIMLRSIMDVPEFWVVVSFGIFVVGLIIYIISPKSFGE